MQMMAAATITRFLQPSDYGLAALAMLCYSMTGYFTQLGVSRAIVQKPGLTNGNIRAAFTLGLATGAGGFAILVALSPLLGLYFKNPRLPPVIIAFGLNLILQSLGMVAGGLLRREFKMRELAISDFLGYLLSTFGIGLPMAIHGFGVWALVGSTVSQPFIVAVAYFIARPHPILPSFHRADYAHISTFSVKASLTTTIEALSGSLDMIVMGRLLKPGPIGLYNRSQTLSTMPGYNASMGLTRVFYPAIARAAERSRRECLGMLLQSERQLMALIFPLCTGAAVAAPTIIPVIFGKQWGTAIPVYRTLCVVAALDASFHLPAIQLEALNLFRHKIFLQVCFGISFGTGLLLVVPRGGLIGAALLYVALQAFRTYGLHYLSARSLHTSAFQLLKSWWPGLLCSAVLSAVLVVAEDLAARMSMGRSAITLGLLIVISALTLAFFYRLAFKRSVYDQWAALIYKNKAGTVSKPFSVEA